MLTEEDPEFDTETLWSPELPTVTFPKSTSDGVAVRAAVLPPEDPLK